MRQLSNNAGSTDLYSASHHGCHRTRRARVRHY